MRRPILLAFLAFASPAAAAPVTRGFTVTGFDRIAVTGSFDVAVRTGPGVSVRATGNSQAIDRLSVTVENGMLRIRPITFVGGSWSDEDVGKIKVAVTVPALRFASLAGSGSLAIDRIKADAFEAKLSGSGDMTIGAVQAARLTASITGSGNLAAAGKVKTVNAAIAGSGDIAAGELAADDVTVSVTGAGNAALTASHSATVSAVGSGDVTVTGTAKCAVTQRGSGSVACGRKAG